MKAMDKLQIWGITGEQLEIVGRVPFPFTFGNGKTGQRVTPKQDKTGQWVNPKWDKTGWQVSQKWDKMGQRVTPKQDKTGQQVTPKWDKTGQWVNPKWDKTGWQVSPKQDKTGQWVTPKRDKTGQQVTPKWDKTGQRVNPMGPVGDPKVIWRCLEASGLGLWLPDGHNRHPQPTGACAPHHQHENVRKVRPSTAGTLNWKGRS